MKYQEELRQETSIIYDGVYEMMHELAFIEFAGKKKNGGLPPADASKQFWDFYNEAKAIRDELGLNPQYSKRVAIKKQDLVVFRDQQTRSKGYTMSS